MATLTSDELRWAADQVVHHCGYPSAVLSGIEPDPRHLERGGFHCSIEDLVAHDNGHDFSNIRPDDKGFNPKYGAAFDVSLNKADMVRLYGRVHTVWADPADPRREYLNAVNCWDGTGNATRFDFDAGTSEYASPDHQWHTHGEIHRRYVRDAKAARAVVSMFSGESKAAWNAREESPNANGDDDMAALTADETRNAVKLGFYDVLSEAAAAAQGKDIGSPGRDAEDRYGSAIAGFLHVIVGGPVNETAILAAIEAGHVDPQALIGALLAGLTVPQFSEAVAAALPPALARQVADEIAARLKS